MSGTLNADNAVLLAMQYTEKLSLKKKESLLNAVEFPAQLLSEKSAFVRTLLGESADEFYSHAAKAEEYAAIMESKGVSWVSYLDDAYPETLRAVDMRPLMLFAKGDVGLLSTPCIAVVGTRKPTRYGLKLTDSFVREFARAGLTVVSGFARGIDGAAHKACVESGAPTIAVFACGVDVCYPAEHRWLYDAVLKGGGLIVSEYPLGTRPAQYRFPERNRIISGISKGVLLTEAAEKSGSLITVNCAVEQGKDVFVVPGNVYSQESAGCNAFLKEMPHAFTVSPDDVLEYYRLSPSRSGEEREENFGIAETAVLEALHGGELHFEEILEASGLTAAELSNVLVNLELAGAVEQTGGNYYSLC